MSIVLQHIRAALLKVGFLVLIGVLVALLSLMLPVKAWRTGEPSTVVIPVEPAQPFATLPARVWIDTDAACGEGRRVDPDDCLAILLLAQHDGVDIVGVSTVFGNAPLPDTDRTTQALMASVLKDRGGRLVPVYRGSSEPVWSGRRISAAPLQEAHEQLRAALDEGPLTIVALGPLTNIAIALRDRPNLQANVTRLVAVMGRRRGHIFHPIEGGTAHSFLGHGPIFRDFNFTADEDAATGVIAMGLPMTLVPYEAARDVVLGPTVLDAMEADGGAAAWVAQRVRPWQRYWQQDIGLEGFYPFDAVAAVYVVEPSLLRCAEVPLVVEQDSWLFGWLGYRGLFLSSEDPVRSTASVTGAALYCPKVSQHLATWLTARLTGLPRLTAGRN